MPVCSDGGCGCPSWLLGSSIVLVLLCPPETLRPGCLSVWGVPPGRVASVGLGGVPVLWSGSVFRSQPDTPATIRSSAVIWVSEVAGPVCEAHHHLVLGVLRGIRTLLIWIWCMKLHNRNK
ncbi:hypothetical protein LDENG_00286960 [Lucifuga dentata]|nr:hypothetical protein LDENG_00286960 [Lucifuga dentata]